MRLRKVLGMILVPRGVVVVAAEAAVALGRGDADREEAREPRPARSGQAPATDARALLLRQGGTPRRGLNLQSTVVSI